MREFDLLALNIDEDSNKFRPDPVTSPDEKAGEQYKLQKGDIVFARTGASVGKSYLYEEADGNLAFAGFLIRFSIRKDVANPVFIFLQTLTHMQRIGKTSIQSANCGL